MKGRVDILWFSMPRDSKVRRVLDVGRDLRLKAGPDVLRRINEPGHFVGPDLPVQSQPIEPGHFAPHPGKRVQRDRITRGAANYRAAPL